MSEPKLSKKQQKALQFRKNKEDREKDKKLKEEKKVEESEKTDEATKKRSATSTSSSAPEAEGEQPVKKRKTRRGKKGKGVNGGKGPRFILFVGNLPYDITEDELKVHFKNSGPDRFRIRADKGIAFLEFDNDTKEIQSKMERALALNHSTLKKRKINVELTVGGGGNSENRVQKLKEKNEKLLEERRSKIAEKKKTGSTPEGMHPSRAALLNN